MYIQIVTLRASQIHFMSILLLLLFIKMFLPARENETKKIGDYCNSPYLKIPNLMEFSHVSFLLL